MDRKSTILALVAGLALSATAPLAMAGDRDGYDGWRHDCGCQSEDVHLGGDFFADSGGVGPAFIEAGGSGGAGVIAFAGANAFASSSASASASARVSVNVQVRQHMMQMHMMKMKMMPHYGKW